ncbi:PRC-barrel domain-containing protein [Rhizobium halophytocola]|uniref:Sporulation protein YlmC with PRC-barrel domain n=1 Tax=Rhizobium halophytocola TaxID=735519 RepID=A0ABS4E2I8_9HYPH|nr:PRC-barrel domain-containing protein [Rhizobium halophytocola]MBP1852133.1 sporulation protein YlmC with PRC-barrel domain [Rhizobium halophytocola]
MTQEYEPNNLNVIDSDQVQGIKIFGSKSEKLGSIDKLVIHKAKGHICFVILRPSDELEIGSDLYPIPWDTLSYDETADSYLTGLSKDQLEGAPRYHSDRTWTEDQAAHIHDYYGVSTYWF